MKKKKLTQKEIMQVIEESFRKFKYNREKYNKLRAKEIQE